MIQLPAVGIGVAVEKIIRSRGLESDRQSLTGHRTVNHAWRFQIFGKEIIPFLHLFGVHQNQLAGHISRPSEVFCRAIAYVNYFYLTV